MTPTIELLSPAGSADAGYAALAHGADAVYLGMPNFSARATADNVTVDQLRPFLNYAHGLSYPRRVYVAMNTLVRCDEFNRLLEQLAMVSELGVDAVIVQDLGVLRAAREHFPELTIHASTQMAIHNRDGAEFARRCGVKRVILARELSLDEVSTIASVPDLEVEVFIHGALCYAYSGLCLLSSHLRGTSGNRGECSYLCRERFNCSGVGSHPMSMRDLAVSGHVEGLREAGVTSLKIEGRKKSPLYVAAVTNYYRHLLDGDLSEDARLRLESDVSTIFSREQTTFFMNGKRKSGLTTRKGFSHQGSHIGTVSAVLPNAGARTRLRFSLEKRPLEKFDGLQVSSPEQGLNYGFCAESFWAIGGKGRGLLSAKPGETIEVELPDRHPPVPVGAAVACISSTKVKRSYAWDTPRAEQWTQSLPAEVEVIMERHKVSASVRLAVHGETVCASHTVVREDAFEDARNDPTPIVEKAFSKLGGTPFTLGGLQVENADRLFVPMAILNELRRGMVDKAVAELREARHRRVSRITLPSRPTTTKDEIRWSLKVDALSSLRETPQSVLDRLAEVIVVYGADYEEIVDTAADLGVATKLRLALPSIVRGYEETSLEQRVRVALDAGARRWQTASSASLELLGRSAGDLDVIADWQLYASNPFAVEELLQWGLTGITASPEETRTNLLNVIAAFPDICIPVYQDTPLAISEACVHAGQNNCVECEGPKAYREATLKSERDTLLAITHRCRTVLINEVPFTLVSELDDLRRAGASAFRMDFQWRSYDPSTVARIVQDVMSGTFECGHTGSYHS